MEYKRTHSLCSIMEYKRTHLRCVQRRGWHHGCLLREAVGGGDGYYPLYPCPLDGVGGGAAGAAPVGVGCVADRAWFEVAIVGSLAVMSRVVVGVLGRSVVALICMCGEQRAAVQFGG